MKSKTWTRIIALVLFDALPLPLVSSAQEQKGQHHHYKLIDVGTFGGPRSQFSTPSSAGINNRGTATGVADTSFRIPTFQTVFLTVSSITLSCRETA